eukprot:UN18616
MKGGKARPRFTRAPYGHSPHFSSLMKVFFERCFEYRVRAKKAFKHPPYLKHPSYFFRPSTFSSNHRFKSLEASSLPSKYQVTCDQVISRRLVAFRWRRENILT